MNCMKTGEAVSAGGRATRAAKALTWNKCDA